MKTSFRLLVLYFVCLSCLRSAEPRIDKHLREAAFLLGAGGRGPVGTFEDFYPNEKMAQIVYLRRALSLAKKLGLVSPTFTDQDSPKEWEPKIRDLLSRLMADKTSPTVIPGWDAACSRTFLIGSYCRYNRQRGIGFVSTGRAEIICELILDLYPGGGVLISTWKGAVAPGGSKVDLPEDPIFDQIIEEAFKLVRPAKEEPNQSLQPTAPSGRG